MYLFVGLPGFEPGITAPKTVVFPLHHSPIKNNTYLRRPVLFPLILHKGITVKILNMAPLDTFVFRLNFQRLVSNG